jgi:hypothetical protein
MGKKKAKKAKKAELKKRGHHGKITPDQESFLASLIPNFRSCQITKTYNDFWASTHAEWSKRWSRPELTEEEKEAGVTDTDKCIKELKVSCYWIS